MTRGPWQMLEKQAARRASERDYAELEVRLLLARRQRNAAIAAQRFAEELLACGAKPSDADS